MKRLILSILISFLVLFVFAQNTPVKVVRIENATTAFGSNLSIGDQVYNIASGELWVAKTGVIGTATLTTASASFNRVNGGGISAVTSSTASQLTVANGTTSPSLSIVTGAVTNNGTSLTTGGQVYNFVTGQGYLSSETDPSVKAVNGLVKSNGTAVSTAVAGTDYQSPLVSGTSIKTINSTSLLGSGNIAIIPNATHTGDVSGSDVLTLATVNSNVGTYNNLTVNAKGLVTGASNVTYLSSETDPTVKAINGIVKSNGTTISAAVAGDFPILNQNTTGTAATVITNANMTGDVTSVGNTTTIAPKAVTLAKMNDMASGSLIYRKSPSSGAPEVQTLATLKTDLGLSGTNAGDVTIGTANGLSLAGQALSMGLASSTTAGALSSTDWNTFNSKSSTTGTVTSVAMTVPTGLTVTGGPVTASGTLALAFTSGYSIPTTANQTNWSTAYTDRLNWDGGATGLNAATGRTSLGATTVGSNVFTSANPTAISFLRANADNTVSWLDASAFRTAIGAGTSSTNGTVTNVTGTLPIVSSGGAAPVISINAATTSAAGSMSAADKTKLDGITGTNTGDVTIGTANGLSLAGQALSMGLASSTTAGALSSTDWINFNSKSSTTGTVTSVAMTVPTGLTVTGGPVTASGTLALAFTSGYSIPTTANQTNWSTAYTDRLNWDGGATGLNAATGRTSLGATTVGSNVFTSANPAAISFLRANADNTVSWLDAATFRTAIGAGTSSTNGTVTGVTGTLPIVSSGGAAPAISINAATTSAAGSMSAADKTKLDGIAAGAQVNVATNIAEGTRTTTTVPITSSTGSSATLSAASTTLAGVMSSADKTKLDGIAAGATNYTHPTGDGNLHVPATGTGNNGKVLTAGASAGSLSWSTAGTVTTASVVTANGITGSVTNPTTTPAINLSLGAITPTSVAATGAVSGTQLTSTVATGTPPLTVTSTTAVPNLSIGGNAATATTAAATTVSNGTLLTGKRYFAFTTGNTGNQTIYTSTNLFFDDTGVTANLFKGDLSGNAYTATYADRLKNTTNDDGATPLYISLFSNYYGNGSYSFVSSKLSFIPLTGVLTAGGFVKSGGTSAQFLKADGSVDATNYLVREVADEPTVSSGQTVFTLSQTPSANSKVKMYINGIRISNTAYSKSGTTLTYIPANNGSYTLVAGDRIQLDYYY